MFSFFFFFFNIEKKIIKSVVYGMVLKSIVFGMISLHVHHSPTSLYLSYFSYFHFTTIFRALSLSLYNKFLIHTLSPSFFFIPFLSLISLFSPSCSIATNSGKFFILNLIFFLFYLGFVEFIFGEKLNLFSLFPHLFRAC